MTTEYEGPFTVDNAPDNYVTLKDLLEALSAVEDPDAVVVLSLGEKGKVSSLIGSQELTFLTKLGVTDVVILYSVADEEWLEKQRQERQWQ